MEEAAEAMDFERASLLRDQLFELKAVNSARWFLAARLAGDVGPGSAEFKGPVEDTIHRLSH
jgi:hypothetical protein